MSEEQESTEPSATAMERKRRATLERFSETKKAKPSPCHEIERLPPSDSYKDAWKALGGWFLGPRAENREVFNRLTNKSLNFYQDCREQYFPADPCYISEEIKNSKAYQDEVNDLDEQLQQLNNELSDSIPFFSTRYQGHMTWETTMPASLGYLAGMMWNQNNVDSTASPVTTVMEIKVGEHLCQMIDFEYSEAIQPWAHLTSCGSVANIEAMWAARNVKFHPLALQSCTLETNNAQIQVGANMPVYVPELDSEIPLKECSKWQLMNLEVDTVCSMTSKMVQYCGFEDSSVLDNELKKHTVVSIGMTTFMMKHGLDKTPVFFCTGTCHYSYPKSATLLGIGDQNIVPIEVDRNSRLNLKVLEEKLEHHLQTKTPVIFVVAVIGSTEESAVDPIEEIYNLRELYKKKGLYFVIHADAAWGGYLLTMIRQPQANKRKKMKKGQSYVPVLPLSEYVTREYHAVKLADTVTIDPHKSGFCQYPAGALAYRNGVMKGFITLLAPEVFHSDDDISVGVYGLEGSKPGAAAAGVLLSHRVIGLDQMGHGRILGQCQLGAKLFYCMWMTVAQHYDEFICLNFVDLPENLGHSEEEAKKFVRERILGKDNHDLVKDKQVLHFLREVGPDALINNFTVNIKGNKDTALCSKLQSVLFDELNGKVGKSSKRIPLFLTKSIFEREKYGRAFDQLKERLGLDMNDNEDTLGFLRNTAMNPFQASDFYITEMASLFRNTVLNCIGGLGEPYGDPADHHVFIVSGNMDKDGKLFLDYMPSFVKKQFQYSVVLTMLVTKNHERKQLSEVQRNHSTLLLRTKRKITIMDFLRNTEQSIEMEVFQGNVQGSPVASVAMHVDEVFRYSHLEGKHAAGYINYPKHQQYFLYGDTKRAFITHVIAKWPSFHQVVELDEIPHSVPEVILDMGCIITVPDISGDPLYLGEEISDPLQCDHYVVEFRGKQNAPCKTTIRLHNKRAKKWFDATHLNTE